MLARPQRFHRPLVMQAVWQRYVYRIDRCIVEKSLIGCVHGGDVVFPGVGACFDVISSCYGCDDDFAVGFGRLDDCCGPSGDSRES